MSAVRGASSGWLFAWIHGRSQPLGLLEPVFPLLGKDKVARGAAALRTCLLRDAQGQEVLVDVSEAICLVWKGGTCTWLAHLNRC